MDPHCGAIADRARRDACFAQAGIPVVDCHNPRNADNVAFCRGVLSQDSAAPLPQLAKPGQTATAAAPAAKAEFEQDARGEAEQAQHEPPALSQPPQARTRTAEATCDGYAGSQPDHQGGAPDPRFAITQAVDEHAKLRCGKTPRTIG